MKIQHINLNSREVAFIEENPFGTGVSGLYTKIDWFDLSEGDSSTRIWFEIMEPGIDFNDEVLNEFDPAMCGIQI